MPSAARLEGERSVWFRLLTGNRRSFGVSLRIRLRQNGEPELLSHRMIAQHFFAFGAILQFHTHCPFADPIEKKLRRRFADAAFLVPDLHKVRRGRSETE